MEKTFQETLVIPEACTKATNATIEASSEKLVALKARHQASMIKDGFLTAANLLSELEMGIFGVADLWFLARYEDRLKFIGFDSTRFEEITSIEDNEWPPPTLGVITDNFLQDLAARVTSISDSETRSRILDEYHEKLELAGYSTHYSAVEIDALRKNLETDFICATNEALLEVIAEGSKTIDTEISNMHDEALREVSDEEENELPDSDTITIIQQDLSSIVDNDASEVSLVAYNDVIEMKNASEMTNETTRDVECKDTLNTSLALVSPNVNKKTPTKDAVETLNQNSTDLFINRGVEADVSIVEIEILSDVTHSESSKKTDKEGVEDAGKLDIEQLLRRLDAIAVSVTSKNDDPGMASVDANKILDDDVTNQNSSDLFPIRGVDTNINIVENNVQGNMTQNESPKKTDNDSNGNFNMLPSIPEDVVKQLDIDHLVLALWGVRYDASKKTGDDPDTASVDTNKVLDNDLKRGKAIGSSNKTDDSSMDMTSNLSDQNTANTSPCSFTANETLTWKLIRLDSPPPPVRYRKTRKIEDKRPMDPRIRYVLKSVPIEDRIKRVAHRRLPKPTPLDWFSAGVSPPSDFYFSGIYDELPLSCKACAFSERLTEINAQLAKAKDIQAGLLRREYHDVVSGFEKHLIALRAERPAANKIRRRDMQPHQEKKWRRSIIIWLFVRRDYLPGGLRFSPLDFTHPLTFRASAIVDRMKWVETRLADADPQQALNLAHEFNQVVAAIHKPYHHPIPGEIPPDDSPKPLPPDLEDLRVRKNRAQREYNNFPSPEYKAYMRKLQGEFKRRIAIYRASEEGQE